MVIYYLVLLLLFGGGLASLCLGRREPALRVASYAVTAASVIGFAYTIVLLPGGATLTDSLPFPLPLGECRFAVDPVTAFFMLPVFFICAVGGILLPSRMRLLQKDSAMPLEFGRHGFFYCMLAAGMVLVLMASDAVLFVIAWEIMSLAPFFLISPRDGNSRERNACWLYLVAAHLGALLLLYLFAGMSVESGSTDFAAFTAYSGWKNAGLFFVLALVGFGVKLGLVPMHMWMPDAYSTAPGHVALPLSGAMVNLGLYGIVRMLTIFGLGPAWWAYALMIAGALSGILGILIGLAQSDLKRTLAYSSAENMGIICLALGAAMLAARYQATFAVALLLGGAFLHIWNHSLFKSLLFLAANALNESTQVTSIPFLGGLFRRIPFTGGCFALGSAAIAGIPPLNGFMSELLMYFGFAMSSQATRGTEASFIFWGAFFMLGAIAGMAVFAFTRMFGLAFLGAPRSPKVMEAHEPDSLMQGCMLLLAVLCVTVSLSGPLLFQALASLFHYMSLRLDLPVPVQDLHMSFGASVLLWYALAGVLAALLFLLVWRLRTRAVAVNGSAEGMTWDCGYRFPTARMQYSGGSFAHTIAVMLRPLLRSRISTPDVKGLFPQEAAADMQTPDWLAALWEKLVFHPIEKLADYVKDFQSGLVNIYILYIFITLLLALAWALGWS